MEYHVNNSITDQQQKNGGSNQTPPLNAYTGYVCPRVPKLKPQFECGTLPMPYENFAIDCSKFDMTGEGLNEQVVALMKDRMKKYGIFYLQNTGYTKSEQMVKYMRVMIPAQGAGDYSGGANARRQIDKNFYDTGSPLEAVVQYHHEVQYLGRSVKNIGFCCMKGVYGKGFTYVSDQIQCTKDLLSTPLGQKMKKLGVCYIRCLTDRDQPRFKNSTEKSWNGIEEKGVYNHWQQSFGVETMEEAQKAAEAKGLVVEFGPENYMKTKFYADAFEHNPEDGQNYLYTSLADDALWFDTWPEIQDLPAMPNLKAATVDHRPLKMTFGDDSEFNREELEQLLYLFDKYGLPIKWKVGEVCVICNYRWAHGRPPCGLDEGDERELGVQLGIPYQRVGQNNQEGTWWESK